MLKKVWNDPVWSKVIAGLILAGGALVAAYFLNWWPGVVRAGSAAWRFTWQKSSLPNWLLALLALLALVTVIRVIRAAASDGRELRGWRSYTSDEFLGLRWRWSYLDNDGTPLGLASFCPRCDFQVYPQDDSHFRAVDRIAYRCDACGRELGAFDESPASLENKIERSIQQKLRNGTWAAGRGPSAVQPR